MKPNAIRRRQRVFAVLPTLLTLANAVCGFGSITFAAKVGPEVVDPNVSSVEFLFIAGLLIFAAMVFDVLDGSVARLTKQTSNFGAQLDSLCDAISFGVAPAFIMLKLSEFYHPRLLWVIGLLFTLCAILRLARFNVETDDDDSHTSFSGLPSPAAAGMVASVAISMPALVRLTDPDMSQTAQRIGHALTALMHIGLPILTLGLACLMVSRIRYPHVFQQWLRGRRNFQHLLQVIFAIVTIYVIRELAVPLILLYFVLSSPLRAAWSDLRRRTNRRTPPVAEDSEPRATPAANEWRE